jgi:hypothetical protein
MLPGGPPLSKTPAFRRECVRTLLAAQNLMSYMTISLDNMVFKEYFVWERIVRRAGRGSWRRRSQIIFKALPTGAPQHASITGIALPGPL